MTSPAYDLVVAGGGTAGSAAAVAAARRGLRVLLVEELNCLGGISSGGGVGEWFASLNGLGDIFDSVVRGLDRFGVRQGRFYNPEYAKFVWQELAEKAGAELLFHASVVGADAVGGVLRGVRIACCSREWSVKASWFVDATGEGDLAALAGAESMRGDPATGRTLHLTLTGWLYDTGKPVTRFLPDGLEPIRSKADLPGLGAGWIVDNARLYLNSTKVMDCDPTDPIALARAELEARRQLMRVLEYVQRTRYPTYALGGSGARIGIREGRRIVGEHVLRAADILEREGPLDFEDGVAVATSQIDFHSLTKSGDAGWRQRVPPYAIPYRCLVPRGLRNLLVAGKCISADQVVQSSCRMTPTCCALGQAAGTALALAQAAGCGDVREVPSRGLRAALAADGMELDPRRHEAFCTGESGLPAERGRDAASSVAAPGLPCVALAKQSPGSRQEHGTPEVAPPSATGRTSRGVADPGPGSRQAHGNAEVGPPSATGHTAQRIA